MRSLYLRVALLAVWIAAIALTVAQRAPHAGVAYPLVPAAAHGMEN